jgi:hypothetical protein
MPMLGLRAVDAETRNLVQQRLEDRKPSGDKKRAPSAQISNANIQLSLPTQALSAIATVMLIIFVHARQAQRGGQTRFRY